MVCTATRTPTPTPTRARARTRTRTRTRTLTRRARQHRHRQVPGQPQDPRPQRRAERVHAGGGHPQAVRLGAAAGSKCPAWQCPSSAPVPPRGAPGGCRQLGTPSKTGPPGAQPLPRMLELAASKAAHFIAFDHPP
eukprot:scaffold90184_cov51-Phaeocystis_antarctica.AAC.1